MTKQQLESKKITVATLKAFMRKNPDFIVVEKYSFDGMIDGTSSAQAGVKNWGFDKTIDFVLVRSSGNYLQFVEKSGYYGINVYNCCGNYDILVKE